MDVGPCVDSDYYVDNDVLYHDSSESVGNEGEIRVKSVRTIVASRERVMNVKRRYQLIPFFALYFCQIIRTQAHATGTKAPVNVG
jgi:hypothetical protein